MKDKRSASSCRVIPTVVLKEEQDRRRQRLAEVAETEKGESCPVDVSASRAPDLGLCQAGSYSNGKADFENWKRRSNFQMDRQIGRDYVLDRYCTHLRESEESVTPFIF